jgi:tetratricopeptide (TPR) repeat protein
LYDKVNSLENPEVTMKRKYWIPAFLFVLTVSGYAQMSKALDAYNQGLEFQDRGDNVNALRLYNKAIELDPRMFDAYNNRANLNLAAGNRPELSRISQRQLRSHLLKLLVFIIAVIFIWRKASMTLR